MAQDLELLEGAARSLMGAMVPWLPCYMQVRLLRKFQFIQELDI